MNNNTRIMSLALAGLAAGGAIWYLMGTEQGRSVRNNLTRSAKDLGSDIKEKVIDKWNDLSTQTNGLASNVANKASDMRENISNKAKGATGSTTSNI